MYDSNGSPIAAFLPAEMREIFGTLNFKKRKKHHRNYLDKVDKKRIYPLIESVFANDPLFKQYMEIATEKYQKQMIGTITMELIKATLLYYQYPQRQHFNYEGLMKVQVLLLRKMIFAKIYGLHNSGFTDQIPIKINVSKNKLAMMGKRIADILELPVYKLLPAFLAAVEIDKELK